MMFALTSIPHEGRRVRGIVATCGRCGGTRTVPVNTFTGNHQDTDTQTERFVRRKLESFGWFVGSRPADHRCQGCHSATSKGTLVKKENVVSLPVNTEQPRQMSREDRRIIFEKLNEVYIDEKTGYGPGWTDAKTSTDLGVPRAWVKTVRDEMFGPEGSNEEIRATIAEAQTLLNDIRVIANAVKEATEPLKATLAKAEHIEKRVAQIQQELR